MAISAKWLEAVAMLALLQSAAAVFQNFHEGPLLKSGQLQLECVCADSRRFPLLCLRGGQRTHGIVSDVQQSLASGPAGGEWLFASAGNADGDAVTILFHSESGVCVEVDHEYSDGGITFCQARGEPVFVYTASNEVQRSESGFACPAVTCALSTGDLSCARSISGLGGALGDWRSEGVGVLVNTFFGSRVRLTRSGGLLFQSNALANKAFVVEQGELEWISFQRASELGDEAGL